MMLKKVVVISGILFAITTAQAADDFRSISTESGEAYYKVIADNNLFRPLGWKAPDLTPKYKLILTKVVKKGEGTSFAYMSRSNVSNPMIATIIKVGVEFDGSEVTEIQSNKVVLKNGVTYEQPSVSFLNTGRKSSRNANRTNTGTSGVTSGDKSIAGTESSVNGTTRQARGGQQGTATAAQRDRWRGQMGRFQNATPEERMDMIEQFRSQRGNRGRRNR